MQLAVRNFEVASRIVPFPDDGDIVGFALEVTVNAVVTDVQRAIIKPANADVVPGKRDVFDFRERFDPVDALRLLRPEAFVVGHGFLVHLLVTGGIDQGSASSCGIDSISLGHHVTLLFCFSQMPVVATDLFYWADPIRSAISRIRFACTQWGLSIISPSIPTVPALGFAANNSTIRVARSISSLLGMNASLIDST